MCKGDGVEIEGAIAECSHIKLVIAHVGEGISKHAHDAFLEVLVADEIEDERLEKSYEAFDEKRTVVYLLDLKAQSKVDETLTVQKMSDCGRAASHVFWAD